MECEIVRGLRDELEEARRKNEATKKDFCEHCMNPDFPEDGCSFPDYGVAPHVHDFSATGSWIGSTRLLPREQWPSNFVEDPDAPGLGTYTHCPMCGRGKKP